MPTHDRFRLTNIWSTGVMECWSNGLIPTSPIFLYSNTPFRCVSESFLSSLQSEFFRKLFRVSIYQ